MTPEEQQKKIELEQQINEEFSQLKQNLGDLKENIQFETDATKKEKQNKRIKEMETELSEINVGKERLERLTSLQEQELLSLKTRLESLKNAIQSFRGEVVDLQSEKKPTPTTCELLKDSETYNRLLNIISSNPKKFKNLKDDNGERLDTPKEKLEYIFTKIRKSIVEFMKNKLGKSESIEKIINNTIAPAFEWSLMELLRDQGNETNVDMLQRMEGISRESFRRLVSGVGKFAKKATGSYNKFSQWMNAVDYLSVHNGVLRKPDKSEVLTNPLKFQEYMNDARFSDNSFSPYANIPDNIFKVDENQTFEFGVSLQEKQLVLSQIGNIQVVNNPNTTALITKMLDKPAKFLKATSGLQDTANHILDSVNSLNSITKIFGVDIFGEIKSGKRGLAFRVLDFICKLIGITGGLDGVVKKWRLDRMNLTDDKNENISQIFKKYKESSGDNTSLSITDENSCKTALNDFTVTDPQNTSSTRGDYLRDSIAENMNVSLISPAIVQQAIKQQIIGLDHINREIITVNGKQQEKITIDPSKFTPDDKKALTQYHLVNMKNYLENYNKNDLRDFYTNIHSSDDIALCMAASLYVNHDDVIEGVKANVFLPENYGSVRSDGTVEDESNSGSNGNIEHSQGNTELSGLSPNEKSEMENLVQQSKTPNKINYLENATYKKYLNIIERDLNLPRYALECVCHKESTGHLYSGNNILGSGAGAKGLFQFIPKTADTYMKHSQLAKKYGKTFTTRDEFLKDPLATAWAAGILYSEFMQKYNYNFQSALACYNRGISNYQSRIGKSGVNLNESNFKNITNKETKDYVEIVTKNVMQHNGISGSDFLSIDLGKYLWTNGNPESSESNNEFLIGPKLLAHNKDEIGGLGDSIMNGFQGLNSKSQFPNMDGIVGKNTQTHPSRFNSKDDVLSYKKSHPDIKSFMFYFGANNNNNQQTLSDIKKRSEWLESAGIQPVLCTCVGENSTETPWLKELNQKLVALGKEKSWPVVDFAKSYNSGDITLSSDGVHPKSYSSMTNIINSLLSQA